MQMRPAKWRRRATRYLKLPAGLPQVLANRWSVRRVRHLFRERLVLQQHQVHRQVHQRQDRRELRVRAEAVELAPLGYREPRDSLSAADFVQPAVVAAAAVHFEFRADFARRMLAQRQ